MFKKYEFFIAYRYLKSKSKDSFVSLVSKLSLIGITLGVIALITVMSVMGGLRDEILGKILGMNGHVTIKSYEDNFVNYSLQEKRIKEDNKEFNVKAVIPMIDEQSVAFFRDNKTKGVLVRGISFSDIRKKKAFDKSITDYELKNFSDPDSVIVGKYIAYQYGLSAGDQIKLFLPSGTPSPFGSIPKTRIFKVVGTFDVGMYQYDNNMLLINLKAAQEFFNIKTVNKIEIDIENPDEAIDLALKINDNFDRVVSWQMMNNTFFKAIQTEKNVLFIILFLMVIIAVFNIVTGQVMMVRDKIKSISILRTMGVSKNSIVRIFFISGVFMGTLGVSIGAIIGIVLSNNLNYIRLFLKDKIGIDFFNAEAYGLSSIPSKVNISEVVIICITSFILVFIAAIYPANKAGKMNTLKGLSNE